MNRRVSTFALVLAAALAAPAIGGGCEPWPASPLPPPPDYLAHLERCGTAPRGGSEAPLRGFGDQPGWYKENAPPGDFGDHPLDDFLARTPTATGTDPIYALDFSADLVFLWAHDFLTSQFGGYQIDGTFNPIGPLVPPPGDIFTGMSTDPVTGEVFMVSTSCAGSTLFTVNPASGVATPVGGVAGADCVIDVAIDCSGDLYALDLISDSLYEVDRGTGAATLVGPTGIDHNFPQGMDFDNESGVLYAWAHDAATDETAYGTIDLETGALAVLQRDDSLHDGAIRSSCPVPIFADGFESGDTSAWSSTVP